MTDWLTVLIALVIILAVVGFFGFLATKMNMSDPLPLNGNNQVNEVPIEKKRKEKNNNNNEQSKKKRKDQKKTKRENKDEEDNQQQQRNKPSQANETDDEHEESEQEFVVVPPQTTETSSKARKRNKNKATSNESNTQNPTTTRVPPATHPKSASKEETKVQTATKQTTSAPVSTKKTTNEVVQNQSQAHEQPFTVVGGNRHKNSTPQTQQNKTQVNTTPSVPPPTAPVQHEQLPQRQQPLPVKQQPLPVKQQPLPVKQQPIPVKQQQQQQQPSLPIKQTAVAQPKLSDIIKALPSSQVVVSELMSALDAFPLSTEELDIIMHKIANKQSVVKQDWSKIHQGQKVDPQAHIGQVLDESAKAYQDDVKNNSLQRLKELADALNEEKRRNNDLLKEKSAKEREIQLLHAQLNSSQQKPELHTTGQSQQKLQTLEIQVRHLTEENLRLNQQQQQQHVHVPNESSNVQLQVLSEQIRKLSVDNANLEKKLHTNNTSVEEAHKEKDNLTRYNEQLIQSLKNAEKELKSIEEKHHQQLNETRTLTLNEINEYKNRIQQLENENEQLKREEIVHVEPPPTDIQTFTVNSEEREQFEKDIQQLKETLDQQQQKEREFNDQIQEYKQKVENLQNERQWQENELKQEVERLKQENVNVQQQVNDKTQSEERLRRNLLEVLPENLRGQLTDDNQDFNQWFSTYRQLTESNQRNSQEETSTLKSENEQLQKNMKDIENQLKEIEKTVQTKEESLLNELQNKDSLVDNLRQDNQQLTNEIQRLRTAHEASVSEARSLKTQLDERFLAAANSPSIITADESFELVKQPTPSLSPIVIDVRAEQLNDLIRSSKEALENQETLTQQLDKHLDDMHQTGHGETSEEATIYTSTDQQS